MFALECAFLAPLWKILATAMTPKRFLLLFCLSEVLNAACAHSGPSPPTHAECTSALSRGFLREWNTEEKLIDLMQRGKLPSRFSYTCEILETMFDLVVGEFNEAGCSWGYPNQVFEARVLSIFKDTFNTDCDIFTPDTGSSLEDLALSWPNITCAPQGELLEASETLLMCVAGVQREERYNRPIPIPKRQGAEERELREQFRNPRNIGDRSRWMCNMAIKMSPCFEGLVDRCHRDKGEASEAIADLAIGLIGGQMNQGPRSMREEFVRQMATCPDEELGPLARLKSVDLEWIPAPESLPSDEELTAAVTGGTELETNWEEANALMSRLERIFWEARDEIIPPTQESYEGPSG